MKAGKLRTLVTGGTALAVSTIGSSSALAVPKEGDSAPNALVEDADGRVLELRTLKGKPILIVYEDKDSAAQNQTLKMELSKLAQGDRYKTSVALAAIADVSAFDFWPAKGFVKEAIREESKKQGTTIYCDWNGTFRSAYRLKRGVSNVVLVGRDGRILFAGEGALATEDRKRLLGLIRNQIEGA